MTTIGIFGGTFDPIHIGHLRTATELLEQVGLSKIRFIPCGVHPHNKIPVASATLRLQMLRAAVGDISEFVIDERELENTGPSYTVETLESLRSDHPDCGLALVVGMDAFAALETWHRWQDLLELAHLIVVQRPGAVLPTTGIPAELLNARSVVDAAELDNALGGKILLRQVTPLDISSTEIRQMASRGMSLRFLVPPLVADLIEKTGCYRSNNRAI